MLKLFVLATGNSWNGGHNMGSSYTDGNDCCNQCKNFNSDYQWASYVLPGTLNSNTLFTIKIN